jgi:hypothetical protein
LLLTVLVAVAFTLETFHPGSCPPWFRIGQLVNIDQTTLIRMEDIPREVIEQIIRSDRRGFIL